MRAFIMALDYSANLSFWQLDVSYYIVLHHIVSYPATMETIRKISELWSDKYWSFIDA